MSCRERLPGEHTDPAGAAAPTLRDLHAAAKRVQAAYRKRPKLPAAVRRAQFEYLQRIERELLGLCPNAATEPACVRRARQYIAAHLIDPLTVEQIAQHIKLSPAHFSRCWNQATGLTIPQYVSRLRVEWGKALLRETKSKIIDLSLDCGFQSTPAFYRWFRKLTGQTPTQYRLNLRSRPR